MWATLWEQAGDAGNSWKLHMTCTRHWKQNVPTVTASRVISPYLVGYIFSDAHLGTWEEIIWRWSAIGGPCGLAWKDTKTASSLKGSPGSHELKFPCALILVTLRSTLQQSEQFCPNAPALSLHFTISSFFPILQIKKRLKIRHLNYLIMFFNLKMWAK